MLKLLLKLDLLARRINDESTILVFTQLVQGQRAQVFRICCIKILHNTAQKPWRARTCIIFQFRSTLQTVSCLAKVTYQFWFVLIVTADDLGLGERDFAGRTSRTEAICSAIISNSCDSSRRICCGILECGQVGVEQPDLVVLVGELCSGWKIAPFADHATATVTATATAAAAAFYASRVLVTTNFFLKTTPSAFHIEGTGTCQGTGKGWLVGDGGHDCGSQEHCQRKKFCEADCHYVSILVVDDDFGVVLMMMMAREDWFGSVCVCIYSIYYRCPTVRRTRCCILTHPLREKARRLLCCSNHVRRPSAGATDVREGYEDLGF